MQFPTINLFVFFSSLPGISTATAEIWKLFQTTIPLLFKDTASLQDEKHIEKLGIIIEKCKEHSDIYVPPNGLSVDQYSKQLPHYKGKFKVCHILKSVFWHAP